MARLIPAGVPPAGMAPRAERELLEELGRESRLTREWTVLHSYDIRRHETKREGEVDMIVLAPGLGVLCVEVKGCRVSRESGLWTYHYGTPRTTREGPFRQARSAMHSLRRRLGDGGAVETRSWLFHSCAVLTEMDFDVRSEEWEPWEVIDRRSIRDDGIAMCLSNVLEMEHRHRRRSRESGHRGFSSHHPQCSRPDAKELELLAKRLRPDFDSETCPRVDTERVARTIEQATLEQSEGILSAMGNPRILVTGAAGTGKTFMAERVARHWAASGLRTALLCYNRMLGQELSRRTGEALGEGGFAGTLDALLMREGARLDPDVADDPDRWSRMREDFVSRRLEQDPGPMFDVLVVDEIQDLQDGVRLDAMDLLLEGGLAGGRWILCGDLRRQDIYSDADREPLGQMLSRRDIGFASHELSINCRNVARVATNVERLGGLDPGYRRVLHEGADGDFRPWFVRGQEAALARLDELLRDLLRRFEPGEIVVLSPLSTSLAARYSDLPDAVPVRRVGDPDTAVDVVRHGTIHAFKGLDAGAIVVTDIDDLRTPRSEDLLYIALSRGRQEVHLVLEERLKAEYRRRIMGAGA